MIEMSRACRSFRVGGQIIEAVADASCRIRARDRIAIMGPSGSGKSTLLDLLAQLQCPTAGQISWPGLRADQPLRPHQMGFVFQAPSLLPGLTALENVKLPLDIARLAPGEALDPRRALELVGLSELADKLPDQMSGGQMQRVALARALITKPKVFSPTNPRASSTPTGRRVLDALIGALEGTATALVLATHDPMIADRLDQCWLMQNVGFAFSETQTRRHDRNVGERRLGSPWASAAACGRWPRDRDGHRRGDRRLRHFERRNMTRKRWPTYRWIGRSRSLRGRTPRL